MFGRPSRSYAAVDHDADGLSSVTSKKPYGAKRVEGGFKTYRPRKFPRILQLVAVYSELT